MTPGVRFLDRLNVVLAFSTEQAQLTWHERPTRLILEKMSAIEVIEQIRALSEEERAKVVRFVIEHEKSWIPTEFREAMDDAARGKMVRRKMME